MSTETTATNHEVTLLTQAEQWKAKGNELFAKNEIQDAISAYSQGIVLCDRLLVSECSILKPTLLSNRAMAYLKINRFQDCIDDCTKAFNFIQENLHLSTAGNSEEQIKSIRLKLLFRRAKAYYMMASVVPVTQLHRQPVDILQDAAKDLLEVLQMDPKSTDANKLLTTVRSQHQILAKSNTPVSKTISSINDYFRTNDHKQCLHHIKVLLGLIDNDLSNVSMELGRLNAIPILLSIASTCLASNSTTIDETGKLAVLAIRCIAQSGNYPQFVRLFLISYQTDLLHLTQTASAAYTSNSSKYVSDTIVSILSCWVRIILHADRDDLNSDEIKAATKQDYEAIIGSLQAALQPCAAVTENDDATYDTNMILRAVLDVIGTWTCGVDREATIRSSLNACSIQDPTVPVAKSAMEIHQMTPQELAKYRKRQTDTRQRDTNWGIDRCTALLKRPDSVFDLLVKSSIVSYDHTVRREATVTVGKIIATFNNDDKVKEITTPCLQDKSSKGAYIEEIVEEVYNEDGVVEDDEEAKEEAVVIASLEKKMERALIVCGMLLTTSKEIAAWALSTGWATSVSDLPDLIRSEDVRAMCLASEVVSAAATLEAARYLVSALVSGGNMELLLLHPDRDIRSGAASAVAKIGLAQQSASNKSDDNDLISMLTGACELLIDSDDYVGGSKKSDVEEEKNDKDHRHHHPSSRTGLNHLGSHATSSVERGVEMMTYLMSNTNMKEEICSGFAPAVVTGSAKKSLTALELLVQTADKPGVAESLTGFGLASIFRNMSITNHEIRQLMFEDKDVTMEQYDELQKMQKTDEEKELMDANVDTDTPALRDERIRKMASTNVPRALVQLTENASEHTLEQIALCMSQMANEKSVRGTMIQQGCLSVCIKIETNESPTITETMKNVIRMCRHTIAKLLITTNPQLLTSAQRLGSVKPLLRLIRDIKAKDLQHFEALMAITNIASTGEDAKNRIVSEKGIAALHYAMFSDHEMVRRAATESMCNLVPHEAMMEHLQVTDNLRLWLAFAEDYEDVNYECARAAAGCLAMATQQNVPICTTLINLPRFEEQMLHMLESGRLEIMHRAFCIALNLVDLPNCFVQDSDEAKEANDVAEKMKKFKIIPFCRVYIENYIRNGADGLEFPPHEKPLLPVVFEVAKQIIRTANPV